MEILWKFIKDHIADVVQLLKILEFRDGRQLQVNSQAMNASLGMLQGISSETSRNNALLVQLSRQGQKDSQMIRTFTLVATMYLPASLIAVRNSDQTIVFSLLMIASFRQSSAPTSSKAGAILVCRPLSGSLWCPLSHWPSLPSPSRRSYKSFQEGALTCDWADE